MILGFLPHSHPTHLHMYVRCAAVLLASALTTSRHSATEFTCAPGNGKIHFRTSLSLGHSSLAYPHPSSLYYIRLFYSKRFMKPNSVCARQEDKDKYCGFNRTFFFHFNMPFLRSLFLCTLSRPLTLFIRTVCIFLQVCSSSRSAYGSRSSSRTFASIHCC